MRNVPSLVVYSYTIAFKVEPCPNAVIVIPIDIVI